MSICLFELWQMWNFFFNLLINTFLIVYGGCVISAQYLIVKSNRKRIVMTDAVPASQRQSEMKWSAFQLSTQRACLLPSCVAPMYLVCWPCCRRRAAVCCQLAAHVPCVLVVLQEACCCLPSTRCPCTLCVGRAAGGVLLFAVNSLPVYPVCWSCCRRRAAVCRQLAAHVPCALVVLQEACCCLLSTRCPCTLCVGRAAGGVLLFAVNSLPVYPVCWPCCRRRAAVCCQLAAHVPCVLVVLQEACCCLLSTRCSTSTRASPRTASPSTAWQTSAPTSCSVSRGPS